MAPSGQVSRKRASSDQLREQANRNVRPAKGKSIAKSRGGSSKGSSSRSRPEGSGSSLRRPSSPELPPPITDIILSEDNSEYEQQESSTDVEEEHIYIEEEEKENPPRKNGTKGSKGFSKDARTMVAAVTASGSSVIKIVSRRRDIPGA